MNSGASLTADILRASLVQSASPMLPLRMWCSAICASAESNRMTISLRLISSEKMTLVRPCLMEADRARSSPRVDLPSAGRAAMMTSWPGCRPLVRASRSVKPVGTPTIWPPRLPMASISARASFMMAERGR